MPQVLQEMRGLALSVPGVGEVHYLIVHRYGGLMIASMHVEVSADLPAALQDRVGERFPAVAKVHVIVEPRYVY